MPRVLIATGGTGGHVFPAMALAAELKTEGVEVHVGGAKLSSNTYFNPQELSFSDIRSGKGLKELFALGAGLYDSLKVIRSFSPDLLIGFGSYYSFPLLAAGVLTGTPLVLWAADSIPGKVIRWFSPWARVTGIQFPHAAEHLKGNTALCSMPLRAGLKKGSVSRERALRHYGLEGKKPVCLVFGGSQGANFINQIAPVSLGSFEVIHLSGSASATSILQERYRTLGVKAAVLDFEKEMQFAWSAADVACLRSGAVSTAELLEFEVPALLVPFPFASENHQEINADFVVSLDMAIKKLEAEITPEILSKALHSLYESREARVKKWQISKQQRPTTTLKNLVMEAMA